MGRVEGAGAQELSGLVSSRVQPGVLWTHNDSGDGPRLLALGRNGRSRGTFEVSDAQALDWEDIAVRGQDLYVGDIGDNAGQRPEIVVYRVAEPPIDQGGGPTTPATPLRLRYPDGPHDAEALLVDPSRGDLVVVTKELDGVAGVYV
ncbi:MAG: PE family protein, partial [Solirubrobacteraceae bacterium]